MNQQHATSHGSKEPYSTYTAQAWPKATVFSYSRQARAMAGCDNRSGQHLDPESGYHGLPPGHSDKGHSVKDHSVRGHSSWLSC